MRFGTVQGMATRQKGLASKIQVPCPDVIKKYNQEFGGVDLVNQRTAVYNLVRKFVFTCKFFATLWLKPVLIAPLSTT